MMIILNVGIVLIRSGLKVTTYILISADLMPIVLRHMPIVYSTCAKF